MAAGLIARAQAGDADAFTAVVQPYRNELRVHCYRMLGSLQDAEDAVQDTLLAAWQGIGGYEARASIRTWLYRIATNRCLNASRSTARRRAGEWPIPNVAAPEPSRLGEIVWLEPCPDVLLGPEAGYERRESISLAFVTALQTLPPRQVAVLVLRDVLGFRAGEVAEMLDSSLDSVNSALKRARAALHRSQAGSSAPVADSASETAVVARFVRAWESLDIDALVDLLTDDVFVSMPPVPFEYEGRDLVRQFCAAIFQAGRRFELVPTRANGQPAFGAYLRGPNGISNCTGIYVLTLAGDRISAMTRFENTTLPWFGLPRSLSSRQSLE
jgi:RNA polymerase sigma-70 factor (ECF subfamily)